MFEAVVTSSELVAGRRAGESESVLRDDLSSIRFLTPSTVLSSQSGLEQSAELTAFPVLGLDDVDVG